MSVTFQISTKEGQDTGVTVFFGADPITAGSEHPNFKQILRKLRKLKPGERFSSLGETELQNLFDVSIAIGAEWSRLSERVSAHHGMLFLDGDPIDDALSQTIVRFHQADVGDWQPLVKFLEKVVVNPSQHSRENLYRWMTKHGNFAITQEGDIIAYKGVSSDWMSSSSGVAFVNGLRIKGRIPNQPNTVIEMPRSEVVENKGVYCAAGLHAASWGYAHSFMGGGKTVAMKINPRDVVSVPTDAGDEKMRVCRYMCLGEVHKPLTDVLVLTDNRVARMVEKHESDLVEATPTEVTHDEPANIKVDKTDTVVIDGHAFPKFFSDYRKADFELEPVVNLRWLCGEWEVPKMGNRDVLIKRLMARRAWAKKNNR